MCQKSVPVYRIEFCSSSAVYWIAAQRICLRLWLVQPSLLLCKTFQTHATYRVELCVFRSGQRLVTGNVWSAPCFPTYLVKTRENLAQSPTTQCLKYIMPFEQQNRGVNGNFQCLVSICLCKRDDLYRSILEAQLEHNFIEKYLK